MGSSGSKTDKFGDQLRMFSKHEQENVHQVFAKINHNSPFHLEHWQTFLGPSMPPEFGKGLFVAMLHQTSQKVEVVDYSAFLTAMASFLKGFARDVAPIFMLLATDGMETTSRKDLYSFLTVLVDLHLKVLSCKNEFTSWNGQLCKRSGDNFIDLLLRDINTDSDLNVRDVETWLSRTPILLNMWNTICQHYLPIVTADSSFPLCTNKKPIKKTMLDPSSVFLITHSLPSEARTEWNLLFNTATDGESFSVMMKKMSVKGQTLLVIRDKGGNVFGGFASVPWQLNASFRGNHQCFLFSLGPNMHIYNSTGYNNHFMYLNQNQQTFPNGLGFGGQLSYFGIWLDVEFGNGHCSPTCVTYNCPQLSSTPNFEIHTLEVWRVGPEEETEEEQGEVRSILDKDLEAKAMLKMMGRVPVSEGLRDEDPIADTPEQKSLCPQCPRN